MGKGEWLWRRGLTHMEVEPREELRAGPKFLPLVPCKGELGEGQEVQMRVKRLKSGQAGLEVSEREPSLDVQNAVG